ncbi:MAG: hypothetical protein KC619_16730 [Myxococcales bacterium]|nr:hypothetical protein [Myxococcales bacterium]
MSDDAPSLASRWPLALGVLAFAGVGIWYALKDDPAPPPPPPPAEEPPAREAMEEPAPAEPAPPPATDFDPDRYARMLLDGGTAAQAEAAAEIYAPEPPSRGVAEAEEVARARMEARAAEAPEPAPPEPLTTRQQLRQVVFWHGLLDDRTTAMREQIAAAEARGDEAAAARGRRILDRLEAQRPEINRRLESLEDQVAAEDGEPADSE